MCSLSKHIKNKSLKIHDDENFSTSAKRNIQFTNKTKNHR